MTSERTNESSELPVTRARQPFDDEQNSKTGVDNGLPGDAACNQATVIVRGETVREQNPKPPAKDCGDLGG